MSITKGPRHRKTREAYLLQALIAAEAAAVAAKPDNDGGSCNHDCLMLKIKGVKAETMIAIGEKAGVRIRRCGWRSGTFSIGVSSFGQANGNTIPLEAANKVLRDYGFDSRIEYITD